ncbi:MAG: TIGR04211 family SH3 domain-containing protein [Gammaproteobacteria bacterium]|nr:TIGR04211 family SH3 domain-containing protein [Gammaproteobacteria bacterium]MBU1655848.1 TIGR04211 family SH3 domain-containing protein [Gammaproteobacteria bacterium]MBU1960083.1 TIGR04211 family SH3 domain-containing protein [Gammaproteobacteria bacterium]
MRILGLILFTLALFPLQAEEVRYVTDVIRFPLRETPDANGKFITGVPSGSKVTLLEAVTGGSEYSRVRIEDGKEGYLESRRLLTEPPARSRLVETEARLTAMNASPDQISTQLKSLQEEYDQLKADHEKQQAEFVSQKQELDNLNRTSASAVQTAKERDILYKKVDELSREKLVLEQRYMSSSSVSQQRWFMIGGGVLLAGLLLGLILPNLRTSRRQKSTYLSGF